MDDKTIKLKRMDKEEKSIPVVCPWCNKLFRIESWETEDGKKTGVSHGVCLECAEKVKKENNLPDIDLEDGSL